MCILLGLVFVPTPHFGQVTQYLGKVDGCACTCTLPDAPFTSTPTTPQPTSRPIPPASPLSAVGGRHVYMQVSSFRSDLIPDKDLENIIYMTLCMDEGTSHNLQASYQPLPYLHTIASAGLPACLPATSCSTACCLACLACLA